MRRIANVVFAIAQAAVPALGYAGLFGTPIGTRVQPVTTPLVPADYSFAIWSFLFAVSLVYAIDQARPQRRSDACYQQIGWLTAAGFAANTLFSIVAQLDLPLVLTGIVFLITAATILPAAVIASRAGRARRLPAEVLTGTMAGWVSLAIFANWSVILQSRGLGSIPDREVQALVFLALSGATAGVMIVRTGGSLYYFAAVGWALAGLIVANWRSGDRLLVASMIVWAALLAYVQWRARLSSSRLNAAQQAQDVTPDAAEKSSTLSS